MGLAVAGHAEWAPRVSSRARWRLGAQIYRAQYRSSRFNDMTLSFHTGPRLTLQRWDLSLLGSFARRWYGDHGYSRAAGPGADVTYYINPRFGLGLSASLQSVRYDADKARNGSAWSIGSSAFHAPGPTSFLRGAIAASRQSARVDAYAFASRQASLSYIRELRGGITIGLSPNFTAIRYDEPLAAFERRRRDRQFSLQMSVLYRRLDFHGLTPRLAYTFTRNDSNIGLYSFRRSRFKIGFANSF